MKVDDSTPMPQEKTAGRSFCEQQTALTPFHTKTRSYDASIFKKKQKKNRIQVNLLHLVNVIYKQTRLVEKV